MAALVSEYTLEFFTLLNARGKKELIEWCMKEGLIASSYECPKCNEQMGLNERKSVVLDGFEWRCRKKGVNTHDIQNQDSIWILTDSKSSIQYLKNWPRIMDNASLDILSKLSRLVQRKQVCLQWIPSHVGVHGHEAADEMAGTVGRKNS
ncbi:uncharacterized protein TNCV_2894721 [Trichonephila clavipes]|nr:uncharacterized protein TNCV_2894721 [Trichonephila clavipes]